MIITGFCPMGCGETLYLDGSHIECCNKECPQSDAVSLILEDRESEHIVELGLKTFIVRHPLRERLADALMSCGLNDWIALQPGPPERPGRYRVLWHGLIHDPATR